MGKPLPGNGLYSLLLAEDLTKDTGIHLLGMKIMVDPSMPEDEIKIVSGKCVVRVKISNGYHQ